MHWLKMIQTHYATDVNSQIMQLMSTNSVIVSWAISKTIQVFNFCQVCHQYSPCFYSYQFYICTKSIFGIKHFWTMFNLKCIVQGERSISNALCWPFNQFNWPLTSHNHSSLHHACSIYFNTSSVDSSASVIPSDKSTVKTLSSRDGAYTEWQRS